MPEEIKTESPHSVELSVNGKGQYSGKCKVYAPTPEQALNKAKEITKEIETLIKEKNNL